MNFQMMNPFERLQRVMPFLVMLYLLTSLAQLHASQMPWSHQWEGTSEISMGIKSSLRWYAQQIGRAEANGVYYLPGN
jgi:hypothetical protein